MVYSIYKLFIKNNYWLLEGVTFLIKKVLKGIVILIIITIQIFLLDPRIFKGKIFLKGVPLAEKGKLDLSEWNFLKNGHVRLNGEWEFYDNEILTPEDFKQEKYKKNDSVKYVNISSIRKRNTDNESILNKGIGTYRLVINIKSSAELFGIKVENIKMSNKLYVNEVLEGSSGNPAEKHKGYIPRNVTYSTYFNVQGDELEIILQTANFEYFFGGVPYEINFGLMKDIKFITIATSSLELTAALLVVLIAIYHLNIYLMMKKDKSFLYLSICFLMFSVIFLLNGEKLLLQVFPLIPFKVSSKAIHFLISLTMIPLSLIIKHLNKNILTHNIFKIVNILCVCFAIISLISIYPISSYLNIGLFIFIISFLIVVIIRLIIVYVKKQYGPLRKEGNLLLLKSIVCLCLCIGSNYIYIFGLINSTIIGSTAFLLGIIFTVNTLSYRFAVAYDDMEKMSKKLIQMNKVKDEFIDRTSYELKAPLYGIVNISETMIKSNRTYLEEKDIKDIMLINNIAVGLTNIINDTLDITLVKNKQLKLELSLIDIKVCVDLVILSFKHIIQNRNIKFNNNIKESIMIVADEDRVRQSIFHIISNCINNMRGCTIEISVKKDDKLVNIIIEYLGDRILNDEQEYIPKNYKDVNLVGATLGLDLAYKLADLMKGKIYLEWSEINKANRFIFSLPYSEEKNRLYKMNNREDSQSFNIPYLIDESKIENKKEKKDTILIVDDEIFNIQTLLNILSREEYNVLTALSGKEAFKKIEDNKIDLVVVDLIMPEISGIDVCKKIREKYSLIELPILISTLKNTNYDLILGFDAGANDFITKPFEEKEIISRTRNLIQMKKAMEEALKNELAFLQAQIKPHFLFNTISTIIFFCYKDNEKAAKLLTNFSVYLRQAFDINNRTMIVPLSKELEMVNAYLEIEKARFGDKIKVEYYIPNELRNKKIPSLSIQPLVENAVKHGICKKNHGGTIYILVNEENNVLNIIVRDTGIGMSEKQIDELKNIESKKAGVGFYNVSRRIKKLSNADIDIYSKEGEGTTVSIFIKEL